MRPLLLRVALLVIALMLATSCVSTPAVVVVKPRGATVVPTKSLVTATKVVALPTTAPSTTAAPKVSSTAPPATVTATPVAATATPVTATTTPVTATTTPVAASATPNDGTQAPTATSVPSGNLAPYPSAPLCPDHDDDHDITHFHTLWNAVDGCHYDHEHGANPYVPEVAQAFAPLGDLRAYFGGVEIGHTNPSSPAENTLKHGGMKIQWAVPAPQGCAVGFESGAVAVDAYVIQYHAFGAQSIEFETRLHSTAGFLRQCKDDSGDYGYVAFNQLQNYGERCLPYQGITLHYPDNFLPEYDCENGQYFTTEGVPLVRPSLQYYFERGLNNLTIWTSKTTGPGARGQGSTLFNLLFRGRDAPQVMDTSDLEHPFTWLWLCSDDGGATFAARPGCKYNNTTLTIHEISGVIPAEWDGRAGFDTDGRAGRVSASAFVTRFGAINPACTTPGFDCHPLTLVNAFVGKYSSEVSVVKVSNPTPLDTPDHGDIYFCGERVCAETDTGTVSSGWVGPNN